MRTVKQIIIETSISIVFRGLFTACVLLWANAALAAPYRCDNGLVFSDLAACRAICGECSELEAEQSGLQVCDTSKYRSFVYYSGKTYALTKSAVFWDAEKAAIIANADTNSLLSKLLRYYKITNAWIGASDSSRSGNYNSVNTSRFQWRDNSAVTYSNWEAGQPDNKLENSDIGNTGIYGEHWALMRSNGSWHDTGARGAATDNYKEKYHSLVQFDSKLACVSGKDAGDSNSALAQEVCGNSRSCIACVDPNADLESFDSGIFKKCIEGAVFDSVTGVGNLAFKSHICPVDSKQCGINEDCPPVPTGANLSIDRPNMQCRYSKITPQTACTNGYIEINGICTARLKREAVCPYGNYSCIQPDKNVDKFYCSPTSCADITNPGSFVDDEDSNYEGDQEDSGFDDEGNCLGQIYLFSGENKQCRLRSVKNPLANCCQSNNAWKPRFRCNDTGTLYEDAEKCGEICGKPCDLLKDQPPDLKSDILGIPLDLCKGEEKELAFRRSMFPQGGNCQYIGTRCTERWKFGFGSVCVQKKETYCCFQTPLAKIVMQAAHQQLGISWGSAKSPNCRGITPEEFSRLNLDQVDFTAWIESYVMPTMGKQTSDLMKKMQVQP